MSSVLIDRSSEVSYLRTRAEEALHALTHGLGVFLSLIGAILLVRHAWIEGDGLTTSACVVYSASLVGLYIASTLSHLYLPPRLNHLFRALDQGHIYLLIVGTYTPFAIAYLRTPGWLLFLAALWAVAIYGYISKVYHRKEIGNSSLRLYLTMGWLEGLAILRLMQVLPASVIAWVVAGGLLYTLGTVFLTHDRRDYHFHAIWHVLVLAGSGCHFIAIYSCI